LAGVGNDSAVVVMPNSIGLDETFDIQFGTIGAPSAAAVTTQSRPPVVISLLLLLLLLLF